MITKRIHVCIRFVIAFLLGLTVLDLFQQQCVAQTIVLRDLTVINETTINSFDDQAILLSDDSTLSWDQVLQASVAPEQQADFNQKLKTLGLPIYRLKRRVQNLDWAAAQEIAQPIYQDWIAKSESETEESISTNEEIQYLVYLSMMRGGLSRGNRAASIWPFLQAASIQNRLSEKFKSEYSAALLPSTALSSQLSNDLLPIWFEKSEAQVAFDFLSTSYVPNAKQKPQGPIVYLASLAIKTGKLTYARQLIGLLDQSNPKIQAWSSVLSAELLIASGDAKAASELMSDELERSTQPDERSDPAVRVVMLYLSASPFFKPAKMTSSTIAPSKEPIATPPELTPLMRSKQSKALLSLMTIASTYGEQFPEFAAAGLYQASLILANDSDVERRTIQNEIISRFSKTHHGRLLNSSAEVR